MGSSPIRTAKQKVAKWRLFCFAARSAHLFSSLRERAASGRSHFVRCIKESPNGGFFVLRRVWDSYGTFFYFATRKRSFHSLGGPPGPLSPSGLAPIRLHIRMCLRRKRCPLSAHLFRAFFRVRSITARIPPSGAQNITFLTVHSYSRKRVTFAQMHIIQTVK